MASRRCWKPTRSRGLPRPRSCRRPPSRQASPSPRSWNGCWTWRWRGRRCKRRRERLGQVLLAAALEVLRRHLVEELLELVDDLLGVLDLVLELDCGLGDHLLRRED